MHTALRRVLVLVTLMAGARAARGAGVNDFMARTFDDGKGHTLPYRLYVPPGCTAAKKCGLVLYFHGAGERGTDNRNQIAGQTAPLVFVDDRNLAKWPVFMLAPQCPTDQQWVALPWGDRSGKGKQPAAPTWPMAAALAALDKLIEEFPGIDSTRLYVTGLSMGGYGTWDAIVRNPKKFKAAVPICGGYDENTVAPIVNLPIWAFHAEDDGVVPVVRTRDMIAAIRTAGGRPLYTEYPAALKYNHFSWNPAYRTPELLPWMYDGQDPPGVDGGAGDAGRPIDAVIARDGGADVAANAPIDMRAPGSGGTGGGAGGAPGGGGTSGTPGAAGAGAGGGRPGSAGSTGTGAGSGGATPAATTPSAPSNGCSCRVGDRRAPTDVRASLAGLALVLVMWLRRASRTARATGWAVACCRRRDRPSRPGRHRRHRRGRTSPASPA